MGDGRVELLHAVDLALLFAQSIALAIVLAYGLRTVALRVGPGRPRIVQALSGLIFGLLAVVFMQLPFEVRPGVLIDLRNLAVFLAGPFGGGVSSLVAGVLAGAYRLYLGGEGALAGTASVLTVAAVGWLIGWRCGRLTTWRSAGLGGLALLVSTLPWFFFIGDLASGWALVQLVAGPYALFYIGGSILLSGLLTSEHRRRRAEEEVTANERRFRDIAEMSTDWFWEMDDQGRITYVSPRLLEISGYGADYFLGRCRGDLIADSAPEELRRYEDALRRLQPFRDFRYAMRTADGSLRRVLASGKPVFDEKGHFVGYRGSGRDVSVETGHREELEAARREAENANRAKSEFLATMSHELRTPLNAILGFSEIMKDEMLGPHQTAAYKGYSADIHASALLLLTLVNDILDVAKIEAGQLQLEKVPCQLDELISPTVRLLGQRAASRQIMLAADIQEDMPAALVDQRAVRQILINLLTNAMKFTGPGGRVSVSAHYDDVTRSHIIAVSDSGTGIPAEELGRVTEPFYQVKGSRQVSGDGAGLGLALCKALAEAHGGRLVLESRLGEGTTVQVVFPREVSGRLADSGNKENTFPTAAKTA